MLEVAGFLYTKTAGWGNIDATYKAFNAKTQLLLMIMTNKVSNKILLNNFVQYKFVNVTKI